MALIHTRKCEKCGVEGLVSAFDGNDVMWRCNCHGPKKYEIVMKEDIETLKRERDFFKQKYGAAVMSLIQYQHGAGTDPSWWLDMKAELCGRIATLEAENARLKSPFPFWGGGWFQ